MQPSISVMSFLGLSFSATHLSYACLVMSERPSRYVARLALRENHDCPPINSTRPLNVDLQFWWQ